jgi:long-chain fatty acid transport protein
LPANEDVRHGRRRRLGLATAVVILSSTLAAARAARADDMDEFGFGARAAGMGGAMTGLASDWSATYYNPAGLILSKHVNTELGFQYADYQFDFKSVRGGSEVDNRTDRLDPLSAFTLGFSTAIPIDCPDRIALGIGLFLPTRHIVSVDDTTPTSQPVWSLFGDKQDRINIFPAGAVKIVDGLYIGGGASIFATAEGGTVANIGPPFQATFTLNLKPDAGGLAGIFFQPADWLSFGICYRTERSFKLKFNAQVEVLGLQSPVLLQALDFFTPHQVSFGGAIDLGTSMLLALDLTYLNYSAFREPFIVAQSSVLPTQPNVHASYHDTVLPRIGWEYTPLSWLAFRAGYFYRMSPVGSQRNTTFNLVDSDEHVLSIGVGFEYQASPAAPPEKSDAKDAAKPDAKAGTSQKAETPLFANGAVGIDLFFQAHILSGTSVRKSDPNDPVGGWDASGVILNMGLGIHGRF